MIDSYEQKYETFIRRNPLKNIAAVFSHQREDLAHELEAMNSLPEVRVVLNERWRERYLYQWNEVMTSVGILPDHLLIKNIDIVTVTMAYAVLPFFVPTISKLLRDERVIKVIAKAGGTFIVDDELLKIGTLENDRINEIIQQANAMIKSFSSASSTSSSLSTAKLALTHNHVTV